MLNNICFITEEKTRLENSNQDITVKIILNKINIENKWYYDLNTNKCVWKKQVCGLLYKRINTRWVRVLTKDSEGG